MSKVKFYFDEKAPYSMITDLWSKAFGRKLDIKYWKWRFEDNPNDKKVYASYIIDGDMMVAYYAVSPTTLYIDGKPFRSGLINMIMTRPDFQGKGYGVELELTLHKLMKSKGFHALYGFANHQAHRQHRKHAGWHDLAALNVMKCVKGNFRGLSLKNYDELSFESGIISEEVIGKTEGMIVTENRIWLSRDHWNLIWRLFDNPVYDYYYMTIKKKEKEVALIFFKYYQDTVDLMEFFFDATSRQVEIFGAGLRKIFELESVKAINVWSNLHTEEHLFLEKLGFVEAEFSTYFGVIPFADSKELLDYRNWHYRFIDSDVF